jgi:hypothetical protein
VVFGKVAERPASARASTYIATGLKAASTNTKITSSILMRLLRSPHAALSEMTRLLTDPRMRYQSPNAGQKQADDQVVPP